MLLKVWSGLSHVAGGWALLGQLGPLAQHVLCPQSHPPGDCLGLFHV